MGLFPFTPSKKVPEEEIPPPTPEQLQVLLDNAQPSGRRDSCFLSAGAADFETTNAIAIAHGHGIFVCCCGHDNTLKYHDGEYPFLELKCGRCQHVLCKNCLTTAIITLLKQAEQATIVEMDVAKQRKLVNDLFQVCLNCGLSRLAQMRNPDHHGERFCWVPVASHSHSEQCSCGTSAKLDWLKFVIGDPTPYRLDPAKALNDLKNRWIERGLMQKYAFDQEQADQKPPQAKWEALGHRRAQADKTSAPHTDSLSKFKASQPHIIHQDVLPSQNVTESHLIDQPVQGTPKLRPPFRRQPEHLTPVQHCSLKRRGAVRGHYTPRSARSFRTEFNLTPRTASSPDFRAIDRPEVLTRAGTWATAEEHRRLNEPTRFDGSDCTPSFAQRLVPEDDDPYTPTARKPSMMTMHALQPEHRLTAEATHKPNTGDERQQPLERRHTIMPSYGVIEKADDSDDEPTPRQSSFTSLHPRSKAPSEKQRSDTWHSMAENDGEHAVDQRALDRVSDFLNGTPLSAVFDLDSMRTLTLTDPKAP